MSEQTYTKIQQYTNKSRWVQQEIWNCMKCLTTFIIIMTVLLFFEYMYILDIEPENFYPVSQPTFLKNLFFQKAQLILFVFILLSSFSVYYCFRFKPTRFIMRIFILLNHYCLIPGVFIPFVIRFVVLLTTRQYSTWTNLFLFFLYFFLLITFYIIVKYVHEYQLLSDNYTVIYNSHIKGPQKNK